jgi:hypothetical protein
MYALSSGKRNLGERRCRSSDLVARCQLRHLGYRVSHGEEVVIPIYFVLRPTYLGKRRLGAGHRSQVIEGFDRGGIRRGSVRVSNGCQVRDHGAEGTGWRGGQAEHGVAEDIARFPCSAAVEDQTAPHPPGLRLPKEVFRLVDPLTVIIATSSGDYFFGSR